MIALLKAYKFRLYPTKPQREYFMKTFGCVRFVYNKMLEERIRLYEDSKLNPDAKQKLPTPAKYKPEFPFLKEVDSLSLANAQMDLNKAYQQLFSRSVCRISEIQIEAQRPCLLHNKQSEGEHPHRRS